MATLSDLRDERLKKIARLKELGLEPYPSSAVKEHSNREIHDNFEKFEGKTATLSGRIMSWREHGKITFADLQDQSGTIQLYIHADDLQSTNATTKTIGFEDLNLLDIGDFIQATGTITKTRRGEVSLQPTQIKLLTKSLRPLPDKWEGMTDPEQIYRRRYLDLVMNPDRREMFERKARFWDINRQFIKEQGFMEVETPILEHVTGGADARPFLTHHHALDQDFFLRISPELYLKRLIGGGFEKVFVLGPNFRNEGIDEEHLQEYYAIEWYWAYADYRQNMALVRDMFRHMAQEVWGKTEFTRGRLTFDLADDWQEIDYAEVIKERFGIDIFKDSDDKMANVLKKEKVRLDGTMTRNRLVDNLWKLIRKTLSGPAFLINEPKFMSPLAKSKLDNPALTERFHVVIAGSELGNGYSELNDPLDQLARFREQQAARDAGDHESQMLDIDYVEMLEYGMPPTSGYAHSERAFWLLEGVSARGGTLFPQMKHHISELTRELYDLPRENDGNTTESTAFGLSGEVRQDFPGIYYAVVTIDGVSVAELDSGLEELKASVLAEQDTRTPAEVRQLSPIQAYRALIKATGGDPSSKLPSPEALLRRIAQGKELYTINTAVDAYNLAVIESGISLGGFDSAMLTLPAELRYSREGESVLLLGDEDETALRSKQLIYADTTQPLTVDLNYRDNNATKITLETQQITLFADGAPGIPEEQVIETLQKGAAYIQQFCGGTVSAVIVVK